MRASTHSLTDVDEACDVLRRHFYAIDANVLAWPAEWTATFAVAGSPAVTIGDLSFGVDVRIFSGELDAYHVNMPLTGRLTSHQGSDEPHRADTGHAAVYQPVGDTTVDSWDGDCRILAVKISRRDLENQLASMLETPVRGPLDLSPLLDVTHGPGATWARLTRMIAADTGLPGGLTAHPVVGARLRESMITGLLLATGHRYRDQLDRQRPSLAAPGAIRRVVDAMRAQPGRPFTVADLAEIAGVGVRSLQQSFHRYAGMPPMSYLRQLRLGLVHDDLREAPPGTTVAQIAYRYGFTHAGRFAAAYRERYGEAPIDTLRR
ncbi:AraC family transcriptional regulator [Actinoplanes sp. GCM10030250]|uniref:AraC family transcriptional regulator n=1 Tax=Actinoplanes sp. GCM10030250 TaxID=3273376 RepID=UPI00361B0485